MWVYAVEMEDENLGYNFEYSMKAGEQKPRSNLLL